MKNKNLLVVSAHAGDFIWRAGGTIAKYVKEGANVTLIILSFGARGESNDLWNIEGQTLENVKAVRRAEIEAAAKHLGVTNYEIWDYEDYHMEITPERTLQLLQKIREVRPDIILSHGPKDAFNPDHETVSSFVFETSVLATSNGVRDVDLPCIKQAKLFGFEPHQSEISDFKPDVIVDITDTYEQKLAAMNCFKAQKHLIDYYAAKAALRGNHARRCSGKNQYKYAEAFYRFFPLVGEELI
ncbi:PIG-L deacetylase family protein [Ureibacillus thermophilus]|uniref:PIG-L family deacetylase n=1 Tax=Ureibacillus thermophilus TaxID=367743 RepID=A0A4P6USA6_9BACL|nr:PIG-L deacetylase family protein [Ureibacillus thermophilus]QBK25973.1 PIG-L family deacetylase [Ureibacillus thermophilus]